MWPEPSQLRSCFPYFVKAQECWRTHGFVVEKGGFWRKKEDLAVDRKGGCGRLYICAPGPTPGYKPAFPPRFAPTRRLKTGECPGSQKIDSAPRFPDWNFSPPPGSIFANGLSKREGKMGNTGREVGKKSSVAENKTHEHRCVTNPDPPCDCKLTLPINPGHFELRPASNMSVATWGFWVPRP